MLLTDIPDRGESFRGFFQRIADMNGYPNADWMCRHALKRRLHGLTRQEGASLVRIDVREFDRCDGVMPDLSAPRRRLLLGGTIQPENAWRLSIRQVCPACLDEAGRQIGRWEHLDHVICGVHGLALQSVCPGCRRRLDWNRCGQARCSCGVDLRELPKVAPSEALELGARFVEGSTIVLAPELTRWTYASLRDRQALVTALGDLECEPQLRSVTHEMMSARLEFCGRVLSEWPSVLYDKLNTIDLAYVSMRRAFGRRLNRLGLLAEAGRFEGLSEILARFVQDERITPAHPKALSRMSGSLRRRGSGKVACRLLGTRRAQVARLVATGRIAGASVTAGRRRFMRVELSSVHRYRERRSRALSRQVVRDRMGLSRARFAELCRGAILPAFESPQTTGNAEYRLDCDAVETLSEQLRKLAIVVSACPPEGITLQTACRTRIKNGELSMTMRAILDGRLPVLGRLPGVPLIMSLIVDSDAHLELLEQHRATSTRSLSIMEMAAHLKVKQEVAYHLVNHGFLETIDPTEKRRRHRRVAESELFRFQAGHVWLRDLARRERTSPRHLLKLLTREGILPVTGPCVDGCRQILFERVQLNHWNPLSQVTNSSKEASA